ncbi:MAG: hypothetical protein WC133_07120, partial [Candidatus Omnitrophota bacterium]
MRFRNSFIFCLALTLSVSPLAQAKEKAVPTTVLKTPTLSLEECYRLALIQSETVAIQKEA